MTYRTTRPRGAAYDVIVIGAGHAGAEAALAAARVGASVLVLTPNLDRIGFMPCNPSIGGPAKGHIVAEVDALGGEMARAIDRTALQIRELNESKGPAVRALRAQADKTLYSMAIKEALELASGIELRQESATSVQIENQGHGIVVSAVTTDFGNTYRCGAAVVTAGTFLRGNLIAGEWRASGGRAGESSSGGLAMSIGDIGISLRRLKTGTPPRIDARTIDFSLAHPEPGSDRPLWFSSAGKLGDIERLTLPPLELFPHQTSGWRTQLSCYQVHSNDAGHRVILGAAHRSPMLNGTIQGVGPRYCPSIEDKITRFRDKESHPLFLEPEGWRTTEVYVQGANTSLPADVQLEFLRTIPALRDCRITRYGYAVEYDAIAPTELTPWFAAKRVGGLFLAGQVNGTSGYEEAAGQGLIAGTNAARYVASLAPVVLRRDQAYIGVMADDLTTQEFVEPYRMLTSRAEHRLMLRCDNAEDRLSEVAFESGLISRSRVARVRAERTAIGELIARLDDLTLRPNSSTTARLVEAGFAAPGRPMTATEYACRPGVGLADVVTALGVSCHAAPGSDRFNRVLERAEIQIRYRAYIEKDLLQIERSRRMQETPIPNWLDYNRVAGLRNEAREKLLAVRPTTLGQASRIPGVTPGDVAVLIVQLRREQVPPLTAAMVE